MDSAFITLQVKNLPESQELKHKGINSIKLYLIEYQDLLNYILEQHQYTPASSSTNNCDNLANTSYQNENVTMDIRRNFFMEMGVKH